MKKSATTTTNNKGDTCTASAVVEPPPAAASAAAEADANANASGSGEFVVVTCTRMDKDPLALGIPLPVLVRQRQRVVRPTSNTGTGSTPNRSERPAAEASGACESSGVNMIHARMEKDPLAVGIPVPVEVGRSEVADVKTASGPDLEEGTGAAVMADPIAVAASANPEPMVLVDRRGSGMLRRLNPATSTSMRSIPGSFAVDGPGLDEEEGTEAGVNLIEATLVPENDGYQEQVIHAEAKLVPWTQRSPVLPILACFLVSVSLVVTAVVLTNRGGSNSVSGPEDAIGLTFPTEGEAEKVFVPMLDLVRQRGFIRCGAVQEVKAFFSHVAQVNRENNYTSMEDLLGVPFRSLIVPNLVRLSMIHSVFFLFCVSLELTISLLYCSARLSRLQFSAMPRRLRLLIPPRSQSLPC